MLKLGAKLTKITLNTFCVLRTDQPIACQCLYFISLFLLLTTDGGFTSCLFSKNKNLKKQSFKTSQIIFPPLFGAKTSQIICQALCVYNFYPKRTNSTKVLEQTNPAGHQIISQILGIHIQRMIWLNFQTQEHKHLPDNCTDQ